MAAPQWSVSKTLPTGVVAAYWVATSMNVSLISAQAQVQISGYISQDAFNAGAQPAIQEVVSIDFSSFDPTGAMASGVAALAQAAQG